MILRQKIYDSNYNIDSYPGVYDANIVFYDDEDEDDDLEIIEEELEDLIDLPTPNTPPAAA